MENYIKEALSPLFETEKELHRLLRDTQKKLNDLDGEKSRFAYELYKEFVDKNWDQLDRFTSYYYVYLNMDGESLPVQKVVLTETIGKWAVFQPCGPQNMNINVELGLCEKDYESTSVVVDEEQFQNLQKSFSFKII